MSSRWRKTPVPLWDRPAFWRRSVTARLVYLNLRTGPRTSSIPGLLAVGEAALAEGLRLDVAEVREAMEELVEAELVRIDREALVIWLPDVIGDDPPASSKVVAGWRSQWGEVPDCPLKEQAAQELRAALRSSPTQLAEFLTILRADTVSDTAPDTLSDRVSPTPSNTVGEGYAIQGEGEGEGVKSPPTPRRGEDASTSSTTTSSRRKKRADPQAPLEIPPELNTPAFRAAWGEWLAHRREKRQAATPTAQKRQLDKLTKLGAERATRAVEYSVAQGWSGIFEAEGGSHGGNGTGRGVGPAGRVAAPAGKYAGVGQKIGPGALATAPGANGQAPAAEGPERGGDRADAPPGDPPSRDR